MQASVTFSAVMAGTTIQATLLRTADGSLGRDPTLPVGSAGTLTTRTDNDTGEATLSAGHGLAQNDKVDVYWTGGLRYGMTVGVVSGNVVPIDGGSGDNLPAESTALVVTKQVEVEAEFEGDALQLAAMSSSTRCHVVFIDDLDAQCLAIEIVAGCFWSWIADTGVTNPLAGKSLAKLLVSNGQSDTAAAFRFAAMVDATP